MKQLTATNNLTGMKIIERYLEGVKYLKVMPKNLQPLVVGNLKKQFGDKEVDIQVSEDGWVRIEKTGENEKINEAASKINEMKKDNEEVDETYILNKEAEMLKQQGFAVTIEEVK